MTSEVAALRALAVDCGVQLRYTDVFGRRQSASTDALVAVLAALGAADRPALAAESLRARHALRRSRALPPTVVAWDGRLRALARAPRAPDRLRAVVEGDDGSSLALPISVAPAPHGQAQLEASVVGLPPGVHRLHVHQGRATSTAWLVVAPVRSYSSGVPRRGWGVFSPVYALRDGPDFGTGHLGHLLALGRWLAGSGASYLAVLPMLATFLGPASQGVPVDPSPYAPASRRHWNEALLDPAILGAASTARTRADLVDWAEVGDRVRQALDRAIATAGSSDERAVRRLARSDPDALRYARFRAALEHDGREPRELGLPPEDDPTVRRHLFAQLLARRSITEVVDGLAGSGVGLLLDLPVGVHPRGYDVWDKPELFVRGMSVGAPPDPFFEQGQSWGFPPSHPEASSAEGHAVFSRCLAHHMAPAAALRIDHVMGLHRTFWIPDGFEARDGVYVRGPRDELFAVVCAASHRYRCRVVGEDLGTVPTSVRRALARHDILGVWVAEFGFGAAANVHSTAERPVRVRPPRRSVASLSTYDTPTFAAWWCAADVEWRRRLGHLDAAGARAERRARRAGRARAGEMLGVGGGDPVLTTEAVTEAALARLGASDAEVVLVALEELWGETRAQNIPGTGAEVPNWSRRHDRSLRRVCRDPAISAQLTTLARARQAGTP